MRITVQQLMDLQASEDNIAAFREWAEGDVWEGEWTLDIQTTMLQCPWRQWFRWTAHKAIFPEWSMTGVDLAQADLQKADLRRTNLQNTVLYGANLREADLRGANLDGAMLMAADLSGANLKRATLKEAELRRIVIDEHTQGLEKTNDHQL